MPNTAREPKRTYQQATKQPDPKQAATVAGVVWSHCRISNHSNMPVDASSGRQSQSEVAATLAQTPAVAQVLKTAVNDAITPTTATGIAGLNLGTPRNGTQNSTKVKDTGTHKVRHPPT